MQTASISFLVLFLGIRHAAAIPCSNSVQYKVELDCEWTGQTHPVDYPADVAHFSPLCGTVHNDQYTLWKIDGVATPGVKDVAELGDCTQVESEIQSCVNAGNCPDGGFIKWMCQPTGSSLTVCKFEGTVTVSQHYSKVSMMTMLAPSPDWNTGVSAVELCRPDGNGNLMWLNRYPENGRVKLLPFDAGTDAGTTFKSPNSPVSPHGQITFFDAMDSSNIFYNPGQNMLHPICRVKFVLV